MSKYRVAHGKCSQFSALEKTHVVSLGRIDRAVSTSYLSIMPITSPKMSLRNTGWNRHSSKINLSLLSTSERLYYLRSQSQKSWCWASEFLEMENISFSLIYRKQKLTRTLTRRPEDFPTAWISWTLFGQWLCFHARQCFVTLRKSNATVSATEHSRLRSCWWIGIVFSRS